VREKKKKRKKRSSGKSGSVATGCDKEGNFVFGLVGGGGKKSAAFGGWEK